jgi:hypothetical protein
LSKLGRITPRDREGVFEITATAMTIQNFLSGCLKIESMAI